ncbi:hypothetical protein HHK36_009532 [Tetracentron sinense]|uniref:Alcohol dehydrogenase n=1 Tax=Tetracentron sinense TaxID=13715 RepID=A0A835DLP8_TETSI|nr:hypothetical protein HHK36_009532 [Tetracentron sinense]
MEIKNPSETSGKAIRCKAAVCRNPGEPLVIEEIEVSPPKAWEVRIKILCTSLCHSDVTFWKMPLDVVESIGEHVEEFKEGDLVVPVFLANCEECRDCKSKKSNVCSKFPFKVYEGMPRDATGRFRDSKGEVLHHFLFVSSFSEYTVVDITHLVKITSGIAVDKACLLSCGVSTGVGAAWKVADVEAGSTVAIFGLGAVGLAVAEGASIRGASKIIGVDLNKEKFEIGKKFGVTDFINPSECGERPVHEVIKEMTDGGADYCFECIGLASLMGNAFDSCRPVSLSLSLSKWFLIIVTRPDMKPKTRVTHLMLGFGLAFVNLIAFSVRLEGWGKTVILGVEMHGSPLSIDCYEIIKGKTITGSLFGGIKAKSDIPLLAQKYIDKELRLDNYITHEVSFQEINKAFDYLLQGKSLRCIIWMDK